MSPIPAAPRSPTTTCSDGGSRRIPAATLEFWNDLGIAPATAEEIAEVEALAGRSLPADYKGFLKDHGFVEWDMDIPDTFDYRLGTDQPVVKSAYIAHLSNLAFLREFDKYGRADNPSQGLPQFPAEYFPIGGTPGQDKILLELGTGRIWYWPERADPWGTGDNTELGYVAESFTRFVEGLRLGD